MDERLHNQEENWLIILQESLFAKFLRSTERQLSSKSEPLTTFVRGKFRLRKSNKMINKSNSNVYLQFLKLTRLPFRTKSLNILSFSTPSSKWVLTLSQLPNQSTKSHNSTSWRLARTTSLVCPFDRHQISLKITLSTKSMSKNHMKFTCWVLWDWTPTSSKRTNSRVLWPVRSSYQAWRTTLPRRKNTFCRCWSTVVRKRRSGVMTTTWWFLCSWGWKGFIWRSSEDRPWKTLLLECTIRLDDRNRQLNILFFLKLFFYTKERDQDIFCFWYV